MQVTVSLAMATYNGAKYLRQLLDSLVKQTMPLTEIVVCDDQSHDDTVAILEEYKDILPIKIFVNEVNLGVNRNFEKAIKKCSCDYILICDQDDVWLENNVEEKVKALVKLGDEKPTFVGSYSIMVDEKLNHLVRFPVYKYTEDFRNVFLCVYQGSCTGFSKSLVPFFYEWPENFRECAYDRYISYVAALVGKSCNLPKNLMLYRCHANNVALVGANKFHVFLRRFMFVNKLISFSQRRPYVKALKNLQLMLKSSCYECAENERKVFFSAMVDCLKNDKVDWFRYMRKNDIALSFRLKTMLSALLLRFMQ